MNFYRKHTAKPEPYSFLVIDATVASDNSLCFRKNLSERIWKLIMTDEDRIRDGKLQYNNGKAAKVSTLSSGKIGKFEYLTGEEI